MVTRPRDGLYVWVTWLSKLMAGEVRCHWAPWFRTHYTDYLRAPSDFQMAAWTAEHTQMLDQLVKEREGRGEGVFKEDQNRFRVRRPSGLTIALAGRTSLPSTKTVWPRSTTPKPESRGKATSSR